MVTELKHCCPFSLGDEVWSCFPCRENSIPLSFQEIKKLEAKTKTDTHGGDLQIWIRKAVHFFITQCRIYGCLLPWWVMSWNHSCKICRHLGVRDVSNCSRRNPEFVWLECAEFGKFHICVTTVIGISASWKCLMSCFASAAIYDIMMKTSKILIVEI